MPKDPFGFLKTGWHGFQSAGGSMASMAMPTNDPAELERRIADLKTVEQWLDFNLTLLRTTIQGLEIQRGTLLALKAWKSQGSDDDTAGKTGDTPSADINLWWNAMQDQFQQLMQAAQNLQTGAAAAGSRKTEPSTNAQAPSANKTRKKPSGSRPSSTSKGVKRP
ncbi:MAG: PhaM family polyhydroxyalkanoate granule multifunctional regulatory protein [Bordetella sp.]